MRQLAQLHARETGHSGHSPAEQHGQRSLQPDPQGHVWPSVPFPSKTGPRPSQQATSRCHPAARARSKKRPQTSLCVGGRCSRGRPGPSTCRKDAGCPDPSSARRVGLGRMGWSQPCLLGPRCRPSLKEGEASGKSIPGGSGGLQAALFDHYNGKLVMTSKTMITHLVRVSVSCGKEVRLWSD